MAFGDDAAVSGGLVCGGDDAPVFCGDAIADPLTGLHAALAVAQSLRSGGGELIEMSLSPLPPPTPNCRVPTRSRAMQFRNCLRRHRSWVPTTRSSSS